MMKQFVLAIVLIAIPVGAFSAYQALSPQKVEKQVQPLGDLSDFKAIAEDVRKIAAGGDLVAAEKRATDFETLWDDREKTLRALDAEAWGNIDAAADGLFKSLRRGAPTSKKVDVALAELQTALDSSGASDSGPGLQTLVDGISVTDANGHAIPCETLVAKLKVVVSGGALSGANKTKADDYLGKAMERCNADDDARANAFSAHGLALARQ